MMQNRFRLLQVASDDVFSGYSDKRVNQAITFFRGAKNLEWSWNNGFKDLVVTMYDKTPCEVVLSIQDITDKIVTSCTCATKIADDCKHIIAALWAAKIFSRGVHKHYSPYDNKINIQLYTELFYGSSLDGAHVFAGLPEGISICLYPKNSIINDQSASLGVNIIKDGTVLSPADCANIEKLKPFEFIGFDKDHENTFIKHIDDIAKLYPLYIFDKQEWRSVKWDNNFLIDACTEVDILDDNVMKMRKIGRFYGVLLEDLVLLDNHLLLDRATGILGRAVKKQLLPWYTFNKLQKMSSAWTIYDTEWNMFPPLSRPISLNLALFNQAFSNEEIDLVLFKRNGQACPTEHRPAQARITISNESYYAGMSALLGTFMIGEVTLPTLPIDTIYQVINSAMDFFNKLKDSTRYALALKGFFAAGCAQDLDEVESIYNEIVGAIDTPDMAKVTKTFKKSLRQRYIEVFSYLQNPLPYRTLYIYENAPVLVSTNDKFLWLFYAIPQIIFSKCKIDYYRLVININTIVLHKSLSVLQKTLHKHGIDLYIDAKQVKAANVDITIDTTHETDWFELHPEVRHEGIIISAEEWAKIVAGNGIWHKDDEILIVDDGATTALGLLARWINNDKDAVGSKSIVSMPRLRMFDFIEMRKNGVTVTMSEKDETILKSLSDFTEVPKIAIPKDLKCTLRDYQKEGYYWLAFLYQHQFGACLADDMGLGKTVQALSLLGAIHEGIIAPIANQAHTALVRNGKNIKKPHLIVVPTSLVFNWVNEINSFYPNFRVKEYTSTINRIAFDGADIFITTYDIVRRDIENLKKIDFNIIIFDEAQTVKNIVAQRTSAARLLRGDFKLCITGTPLENHIGEYYSIMDLAIPGLLVNYAAFKNEQKNGISSIVTQTRPFILRRTKEIISKELPEKIESDVYFAMTDKQRALYTRIVQDVRNEVTRAYETKTKGQASIVALTALLRLRQICISPDLVLPAKKITPSPKIEYLTEQLPGLIEQGHAALIFSQFTSCLDIVEGELKSVGVKYARIDGSVSLSKRKDIIQSFQDDKVVDVLLMSLKTGGVGLNLTRASYVFHVDPWWNAAVENQASDRAYRIGQKNTVMVIRLLMHHSIEEKMLAMKKSKIELFKAVVEGAAEKTGSAISQQDMEYLLS